MFDIVLKIRDDRLKLCMLSGYLNKCEWVHNECFSADICSKSGTAKWTLHADFRIYAKGDILMNSQETRYNKKYHCARIINFHGGI